MFRMSSFHSNIEQSRPFNSIDWHGGCNFTANLKYNVLGFVLVFFVCVFFETAVTNYHKLGSIKQNKFIISQICGLESKSSITGLKLRCWQRNVNSRGSR